MPIPWIVPSRYILIVYTLIYFPFPNYIPEIWSIVTMKITFATYVIVISRKIPNIWSIVFINMELQKMKLVMIEPIVSNPLHYYQIFSNILSKIMKD